MLFLSVLLFILGACVVLLLPLLAGLEFYRAYNGPRAVTCPENQQQVAVSLDALHAAATRLQGTPNLRLGVCTRWPERAHCDQQCIPEARRKPAFQEHDAKPLHGKPVYHLPVLIAAFIAWVIGAIWHSHYFFRAEWMQAVGLSRSEVHELVWRLGPHLVTLGTALLFAYGVAWALAWTHKKSVFRGLFAALFLWGALAAAVLLSSGASGISHDLLKLEVDYTLFASVVVGLIVGGLSGRFTEDRVAG